MQTAEQFNCLGTWIYDPEVGMEVQVNLDGVP